jgi:acetyl esterase
LQKKEYIYKQTNTISLEATLYESNMSESKGTIIYFHGGALIWGYRNDLPEKYISMFLNNGYNFLSVDYPLAPESKLEEIYFDIKEAILWFYENALHYLNLNTRNFYLFGRSAGSYLAFLLAKDSTLPKAAALLIFYGYSDIHSDFYNNPSEYYLNFPRIDKSLRDLLVKNNPIKTSLVSSRYAIYVYARQHGTWVNDILKNPENPFFSISDEDLASMPCAFLAHSKYDKDVPFHTSIHHSQIIPNSKLYTVDSSVHEFDQDINIDVGYLAYTEAINFLKMLK